jgi:hypothetical protein
LEHLGTDVVRDLKGAFDNFIKEIKQLELEDLNNNLFTEQVHKDITERIKNAIE